MYFDFEDYRPDISPVGRAISWREGVLISIIAHLLGIIVLLLFPRLFPYDMEAARARALAVQQQQRKQDSTRFVFVEPRIDKPAPKPPPRAEPSDIDRQSEAPRRAEKPVATRPSARSKICSGGRQRAAGVRRPIRRRDRRRIRRRPRAPR